jgi:hypothetical protein
MGDYELRAVVPDSRDAPRPIYSRGKVDGISVIRGTVPARESGSHPSLFVAQTQLHVAGNLAGIDVPVVPAPSLVGTINILHIRHELPELEIRLTSTDEGGTTRTRSDERGRFSFANLVPGRYVVGIAPALGYSLQSIDAAGSDASLDAMPLLNGERQITLNLSDQVSGIGGHVQASGAQSDSPIWVFAFPADPVLWSLEGSRRRLMRMVPVFADGTFATGVLPPGEYKVVAVQAFTLDSDWRSEESLGLLSGLATSVRVRPGEQKEVHLIPN